MSPIVPTCIKCRREPQEYVPMAYPENRPDIDYHGYFAEALARLRTERRYRVFADLERIAGLGQGAARVTIKTLENYLHLGVIATLFPRARIIHCRRDPVDTCLSCYFQNFGEPMGFTLDLGHLGLYYREYERLMTRRML